MQNIIYSLLPKLPKLFHTKVVMATSTYRPLDLILFEQYIKVLNKSAVKVTEA